MNKAFTAKGSVRMVDLPQVNDPRGDLTFVEGGNHIPFDIARVYYLYNVPVDAERGGHAHRELEQIVFALSGSFRMKDRQRQDQVGALAARPSQRAIHQQHDLAGNGQLQPRRCLHGAGITSI